MNDELVRVVDEAVYTAMQTTLPKFVEAIRELMARGQSPAQIERHLREKYGDIQVVRTARYVADRLLREETTMPPIAPQLIHDSEYYLHEFVVDRLPLLPGEEDNDDWL